MHALREETKRRAINQSHDAHGLETAALRTRIRDAIDVMSTNLIERDTEVCNISLTKKEPGVFQLGEIAVVGCVEWGAYFVHWTSRHGQK